MQTLGIGDHIRRNVLWEKNTHIKRKKRRCPRVHAWCTAAQLSARPFVCIERADPKRAYACSDSRPAAQGGLPGAASFNESICMSGSALITRSMVRLEHPTPAFLRRRRRGPARAGRPLRGLRALHLVSTVLLSHLSWQRGGSCACSGPIKCLLFIT